MEPMDLRARHKNVQIDFELWFTRFSQYAEMVLRGFEEHFFPLITELLHQRDVMVSRSVADIEAEGMSYVQSWGGISSQLYRNMEEVRDLLSTVDNRVLRIQRVRVTAGEEISKEVWNATFDSIRVLIPAFVDVLNDLDCRMTDLLQVGADGKKMLRRLYRQFAILVTKDGQPPLGWSGITTVTRWIADRRLRADHVGQMARASRQSLFTRYRADNSHHTIVKLHKMVTADEGRRRNSFFSS